MRFQRIWLTFTLLGGAYSVFQFATFNPLQKPSDLDFLQLLAPGTWAWPGFMDVWRDIPLPALEGVVGIFDNATTTYPVSALAAVLLIFNWRGLHGALFRALRKRYRSWSYAIYFVLLISVLATLLKPIAFWRLPAWGGAAPAAEALQISATIDAVAFIFEYLFGVYIQVYLITVCLAWIKGLSFAEGELFRFGRPRCHCQYRDCARAAFAGLFPERSRCPRLFAARATRHVRVDHSLLLRPSFARPS